MQNNAAIVWFKNDLRLHDNKTLHAAVQANHRIMPIFILDPRWCCSTIYGFRKTGAIRMRFIKDCVAALKESLQAIGSDLFIFEGLPEKIIPELIIKYNIGHIYTKQEFGCDEKNMVGKVEKICCCMKTKFYQYHTQNIINFSLLNIENFPNNFEDAISILNNKELVGDVLPTISKLAKFDCANENNISIFEKYYCNDKIALNKNNCVTFIGGEKVALQRLHDYLFLNKDIQQLHLNKRLNVSTKFSPWLAQGCLSARYIYLQVLQYSNENPDFKGAKTLLTNILLRDFFYVMFFKHNIKYFRQGGVYNKKLICIKDFEALQTWISAQTEDDYINANMLEFANTGWMNSIGRQYVSQYLSKNMLVDWRIGAAYFESQLIDYDVCLNYANWAEKAGVGCNNAIEPTSLNMPAIKEQFYNNSDFRAILK